MLEGLMLASYGYFEGGPIGDMLYQWEQAGFFSYLLPFLLIFAMIFGILTRMKLFGDKNKAINGILALVVGLMALRVPMVSEFFSEIFPRLGVALSIILVILILVGLFADPDAKGVTYTMMGIGAIVVVIVLVQTAGAIGWSSGWWWREYWPMIAGLVVLITIIGVIVGGANEKESKEDKSILARALRGGE